MARDNKLDNLAKVRLFSSLSRKELTAIGRSADVITAPAGSEVVVEGTIGHEFYLILSGTATVKRNRRKVADLGPGDYFGELALLSRGPRNATVVAESDLELLVIVAQQFRTVLETVPEMAHKLLATMAERLRVADARDRTA